ncbi:MAG: leucine-rich repeat domain-containing protein [Bacteroidota bacterium]
MRKLETVNQDPTLTNEHSPYRYPGVQPFSTQQANVFFGREQDTQDLFRMIRRESMVVVYGKSGLGKSSLLYAGIIPKCLESGLFTPITIRFGAWTDGQLDTPLNITKKAISGNRQASTFLDQLLPEDSSLWFHAKSSQLNGSGRLLLLFDQFEELFTYPEPAIEAFKEELSELLHTGIPLRFRRMAEKADFLSEEDEDQLENPLEVVKLFAIRSDRIHLLHQLADQLPNIFRHMFELKALRKADAERAILLPAQAEGQFRTPPFEWRPSALNTLLAFLQEDESDELIEGILLQLLCQYFEEKLVEKGGNTFLESTDLGDLQGIVGKYYFEKIASIGDLSVQTSARLLIEEGLVLEGENIRLSLHEAQIKRQYQVDTPLLERLVNSRLLRAEPFLRGGYSYELAHDRLVAPVLEAKQKRKEAEAEADRLKREKELSQAKRKIEEEYRLREQAERGRKKANIFTVLAVVGLLIAAWQWITAYKANEHADKERENATRNLSIANKIIDALYFYEDSLALSFDGEKYGYINKRGEKLIPHEYKNALPFDYSGFAEVENDDGDFLINGRNERFKLAFEINQIIDETKALELKNEGLSRLPTSIFEHTNLEILLLSENVITSISPGIRKLVNLTALDLSGNQLTAVPDEITELRNLTSLNLAYNQLQTLPEATGLLKNLSSLRLRNNQLAELPPSLGTLENLKHLDLKANELISLPTEFNRLDNLISLNLNLNPKLESFPTIVVRMDTLENLNISLCNLSSLPPEVSKMEDLTDFDLSGNFLVNLPPEIGDLKNLTALDLSGNQLKSLAPEIGKLQNLISLDLSDNNLDSLPAEIGELQNLQYLNLSENKLASLPDEIGNLRHLTTLVLSTNQLKEIPSAISDLSHLTSLFISDNLLTELPSDLRHLESLSILLLDNNQLKEIPPSIGNLKFLETLDLSANQLTTLPEEFGNLASLKEFTIGLNPISIEALNVPLAKLTTIKVLSLQNLGLTELSHPIYQLTNLNRLIVSNKSDTKLNNKIILNNFSQEEKKDIARRLPKYCRVEY